MVLPCAEGVTNEQVAADLGVDQSMVDRWQARLVADRLDGLDDEPRIGQVAHPGSCSTRSKTSSSRPWNPHRARTLIGELHRCHRAVEFKEFLAATDKAVPADLAPHLVRDHCVTHKTPQTQQWLARHPRCHVHFTSIGCCSTRSSYPLPTASPGSPHPTANSEPSNPQDLWRITPSRPIVRTRPMEPRPLLTAGFRAEGTRSVSVRLAPVAVRSLSGCPAESALLRYPDVLAHRPAGAAEREREPRNAAILVGLNTHITWWMPSAEAAIVMNAMGWPSR